MRSTVATSGLVHQLVLTFLAATLGVMSALMLGLHGAPTVTRTVSLYAFFGTACWSEETNYAECEDAKVRLGTAFGRATRRC
ncbi:MAG: hypothetical protein ACR2LV_00680 [Solirubrobacteraceae bacterium]